MEVGLRIVLILVGILFIGALLIHGLWSIRKERQQKKTPLPRYDENGEVIDPEGFDRDGIGKLRVITPDEAKTKVPPRAAAREAAKRERKSKPEAAPSSKPRQEPSLRQNPLFEEPQEESVSASLGAESMIDDSEPLGEPEDVLVLNVMAREGKDVKGADLLDALLPLGFKFGEMSIFHRHQDTAGNGAVLFSMVNMVKPGTFDVDAMATFRTCGVSLFMTLPCRGEAEANFDMMLRAAEQLSTELGAELLDDQRIPLGKQKIRHYRDRIREYERRRLLTH
ncbi:MAG: cell division protein ZipA [Gammaproteobacteria bacterium]|nr:cell division protein ZipA [Gammaproteobacteria bacterium]